MNRRINPPIFFLEKTMTYIAKTEDEFLSKLTDNTYSIEKSDGSQLAWDVPTLWRIANTLKPQVKPLKDFTDIITRWINYGGKRDANGRIIVPFDIEHFERIREADLGYPIITISDPFIHYNLRVADGMHRLMKCYLSNIDEIKTVCITKMPPPIVALLPDKKPSANKLAVSPSGMWR